MDRCDIDVIVNVVMLKDVKLPRSERRNGGNEMSENVVCALCNGMYEVDANGVCKCEKFELTGSASIALKVGSMIDSLTGSIQGPEDIYVLQVNGRDILQTNEEDIANAAAQSVYGALVLCGIEVTIEEGEVESKEEGDISV